MISQEWKGGAPGWQISSEGARSFSSTTSSVLAGGGSSRLRQTAQNEVEMSLEEAREIERVAGADQQLRDRIAIRAGPITACG
jgi:hypothetical protein